MALVDPVAVYNAQTNSEVMLLKVMLEELGIEAFAVEDLSPGGQWMLGTLPEIYKPQIWVSRADAERARAAILKHEDDMAESARSAREAAASGEPIDVECDECGHASRFPASQRGTIQDCPRCGAYVDVGEFDDAHMRWQEGAEEDG